MDLVPYQSLFNHSFEPCLIAVTGVTALLAFLIVLWPWFESDAERFRAQIRRSFGTPPGCAPRKAVGITVKASLFMLFLVAAYFWWLPGLRSREQSPGLATLMTAAQHDERWSEAMYDAMLLARPRIGSQEFDDARWSYRLTNAPDRIFQPPRHYWGNEQSRAEDIFSLGHPEYANPIRIDRNSPAKTLPDAGTLIESRLAAWERVLYRWELLTVPKRFWPKQLQEPQTSLPADQGE